MTVLINLSKQKITGLMCFQVIRQKRSIGHGPHQCPQSIPHLDQCEPFSIKKILDKT